MSRPSGRALAIGALLWCGAMYLMLDSAWHSVDKHRTATRVDTTTTGHWVDVEDRCGQEIAYVVEGREYRLNTAQTKHRCSDVREGEEVEVSYDADDPANSHRGAGNAVGFLMVAVLSGGSAVALLVGGVIVLRRLHRAEPREG